MQSWLRIDNGKDSVALRGWAVVSRDGNVALAGNLSAASATALFTNPREASRVRETMAGENTTYPRHHCRRHELTYDTRSLRHSIGKAQHHRNFQVRSTCVSTLATGEGAAACGDRAKNLRNASTTPSCRVSAKPPRRELFAFSRHSIGAACLGWATEDWLRARGPATLVRVDHADALDGPESRYAAHTPDGRHLPSFPRATVRAAVLSPNCSSKARKTNAPLVLELCSMSFSCCDTDASIPVVKNAVVLRRLERSACCS